MSACAHAGGPGSRFACLGRRACGLHFKQQTHFRIPAARFARVVHRSFRPETKWGRGECRAHDAPAASRAKNRKHTSVVTTSSPKSPGIPARNGFTAYIALSPVIGLSCHRHRQVIPANLTPASRRQDHTTSPSATSAVRQRALSRPMHPAPRPWRSRYAPQWDRTARLMKWFGLERNGIIFDNGDGQDIQW